MQKRTASIILASTLAVGGGAVALTPASAADSDNPVKSRLAGIKNSLSGLVKDGTLTQEQADKVATTLEANRPAGGHGHGGPKGDHLAVAAKALGMTEAELAAKLKDGTSLADVAKDQNITTAALIKALVAEAEANIDAAVKDGKLTTAEAEERKASLTERITDRVNNVRPEGDAGKPAGGRGHGGPEAPASSS